MSHTTPESASQAVAKLYTPTMDMESAYQSFAREWAAAGEEIVPYSARLLGRSYADWLAADKAIQTVAPKDFVTAHTYFFLAEDGPILGALNLRHSLSDYLRQFGGHIGYGVRPSRRREGHASAMLAQALPLAKALGLNRVLITCDADNIASALTIQGNGGVLENEVLNPGGTITQRYWIGL